MSEGTHLTATVRERAALAAIDGIGISTVAAAYGVDRRTVPRWVSKYSGSDRAGLHRKAGSGRPRKLDELTEDELSTIVLKRAIAIAFETDLRTVSRRRRVIQFLDQMLRHHPNHHLMVVMDQAPPHTSKKTKASIACQPRLHVFHLPKYSPDWNPDEKVWNDLKHQELAAHRAKNKEELKILARRKLQSMAKRRELMRGMFFRCCGAELFNL
jgi:transposase